MPIYPACSGEVKESEVSYGRESFIGRMFSTDSHAL